MIFFQLKNMYVNVLFNEELQAVKLIYIYKKSFLENADVLF